MNKITVSISIFVMLLFAVLLHPLNAWGTAVDERKTALTDYELQWRIDNLTGPFDIRYTSKVKSAVESYIFDYPKGAEELLGRITLYFPLIEEKLRQRNLPDGIKYLSIVESSLKVDAYSRVGAAGLWQFMRGTAKEYGLTVNKSYDQRYDVEESTNAALEYLSFLYNQFDDWTLALAAYNCGPGNVRKAIRKSGLNDYWSIQQYLPQETRNYIPKFVAAYYLMEYFNEHDLMPIQPEKYHYEVSESMVFQHLSFDEIVRITHTSMDIVKNLNPSFRKNYIPVNPSGLKLKLPRESMYSLIQSGLVPNIRLVSDNQINYNQYIQSYFSPTIARYFLIDNNETLDIAPLPVLHFNSSNLVENMKTNTQIPDSKLPRISDIRRAIPLRESISYRLRTGETLLDVARKFPKTDVETIIRVNGIKLDRPPDPGTLLKITEI